MAKLLGPDFISLQVRNVPASRTFYTEVLGFGIDERFDTSDFVLLDTTTIPLGLSEAKVNLDEAPQPGLGVALWIDCDSVDELYARLETAGGYHRDAPLRRPVRAYLLLCRSRWISHHRQPEPMGSLSAGR